MSIFCRFSKQDIQELEEYQRQFETRIKHLSPNDKELLLIHMYKTRHNLLVDLTEEKNRNLTLSLITLCCVALTAFIIICH